MKNWMKLSMLAAVLALFGLMALGTPAFAQKSDRSHVVL